MPGRHSIPVRRVSLVDINASPIDALTVVFYPHEQIHDGVSFTCRTVNDTLADNASIALVFKTASTPNIHLVPKFSAKAAGHLKVIENASWVASTGTGTTIYNRNRNSANISSVTVNYNKKTFSRLGKVITNPAGLIESKGTMIERIFAFGTKQAAIGMQRGDNEIVLKKNTKYSFVFKADAGSNGAQIILDWYENIEGD